MNNVCIKCTNTNRFDKYLREDLKSDTTSNLFINEVNSLNIKLGLCLVHTFTFVTSLLKKAYIFCRAKLSNQPSNIGDEHGNFVVSFLQYHRHIHYMNYQGVFCKRMVDSGGAGGGGVNETLATSGVSNGKFETLRDGETDTFSASPRLPWH